MYKKRKSKIEKDHAKKDTGIEPLLAGQTDDPDMQAMIESSRDEYDVSIVFIDY